MAAYQLVIFDFDGTLADTVEFFMSTFDTLADRHGFRKLSRDELESLRGERATVMFERAGIPLWKLPMIAASARQLMTEHIDRLSLFPGVPALLSALKQAGVRVAIVTSNSEANVRRTLGAQNAALVDDYECGAAIFGKRSRLRRVVKRSGIAPNAVLCVGDETRDSEAARAAGLACGVVSWGASPIEALEAFGPEEVFRSMDELQARLT